MSHKLINEYKNVINYRITWEICAARHMIYPCRLYKIRKYVVYHERNTKCEIYIWKLYQRDLTRCMRPVVIFLPRYTNLYRSIRAICRFTVLIKMQEYGRKLELKTWNVKYLDVVLIYHGTEKNLKVFSNNNFYGIQGLTFINNLFFRFYYIKLQRNYKIMIKRFKRAIYNNNNKNMIGNFW